MVTWRGDRSRTAGRWVWWAVVVLLLSGAYEGHATDWPGQSGRTPAAHVGSVMAMLATFDEAGVLPPESSPRANQLIRALIQFQSAFLKSPEAAVREFLASALQVHGHRRAQIMLDRFALTGWTSESLEAVVEYSMHHSMWENPRLSRAFHAYNLSERDWEFVQEIFLQARQNLVGRTRDLHAAFAWHRSRMPGGR